MKAIVRKTAGAILVLILVVWQGCGVEAVRSNRRAQVYLEHDQYELAKQELEKSVTLDFENPATHYWLAKCYEALNETTKAEWEYALAVRFNPASDLFQMSYIKFLNDNGKQKESQRATKLFLEHKEGAMRDFLRLGEAFIAENMDKQGLMAYFAAAKVEPKNVIPLLTVADYFASKGDTDKEAEYRVEAFKINPYYPGLAKWLGEHGLRVDVPEPPDYPPRPTELEKELFELEL